MTSEAAPPCDLAARAAGGPDKEGREPAGERRLPEFAPDQGVRRVTGLRRPVGDVLCDNYVLLWTPVNADRHPMGHSRQSEHQAAASAEVSELAGEIIRELEQRGVPAGAWLFDIARVRQSLREADTLLRRLEDTIIRSSSAASLDEL